MESFVAQTRAHDILKRLFAMTKPPIYKTVAPARNVTDVVIFRMSKHCHSELATFGRRPPLVAEAREALLICCSVKGRS